MINSASKITRIAQPKGSTSLSRAQKSFNKLIKSIESQQNLLTDLQGMIPLYQSKYVSELDPKLKMLDSLNTELVLLYDQAHTDKLFSKKDKEKLSNLICEITSKCIDIKNNEMLKKIYNRHSHSDMDTEIAAANHVIKNMMEGMLGVELDGDIDFTSSPEEMMARVGEKMRESWAQADHAKQERASRQKKSAKTLAKEEKQAQEAQKISHSLREIYRKLASALHPDREQNDLERDRKTELMQRVNVAYNNNNLLQLLELQLEIEQIDQAMINTLNEDRLKCFIKILTEQSEELSQEVDAIDASFRLRFNFPPQIQLSSKNAMRHLDSMLNDTEYKIAGLSGNLELFKNTKHLKDWLKTYRIPQPTYFLEESEEWDDLGFDMPFFRA